MLSPNPNCPVGLSPKAYICPLLSNANANE